MAAEIDGYGNVTYIPRKPSLDKQVRITVEAHPGNGGLSLSILIQELLQKYMPGVEVEFSNDPPHDEPDVVEQMRDYIKLQLESGTIANGRLFHPNGNIKIAVTRKNVQREY